MALTTTITLDSKGWQPDGLYKKRKATFAVTGTYVADGIAITPSDFKLGSIVDVLISNVYNATSTSTVNAEWDGASGSATSNIRFFGIEDATGDHFDEVADSVNVGTVSMTAWVIGQ